MCDSFWPIPAESKLFIIISKPEALTVPRHVERNRYTLSGEGTLSKLFCRPSKTFGVQENKQEVAKVASPVKMAENIPSDSSPLKSRIIVSRVPYGIRTPCCRCYPKIRLSYIDCQEMGRKKSFILTNDVLCVKRQVFFFFFFFVFVFV